VRHGIAAHSVLAMTSYVRQGIATRGVLAMTLS
jgi:hypothetical protein